MKIFLAVFLKDDSGVTAVEYGLIVVGMAVALIITAGTLSDGFIEAMESLAGKLKIE